MADQRLVGIDRIVTALHEIRRAIEKTATYISANSPNLGSDIVETSGASGILGLVELVRELIGALTSGSGADGSLDGQPGMGSSITEITGASGADGIIELARKLIGDLISGSGIDGNIEMTRKIAGIIEAGSELTAYFRRIFVAGIAAGQGGATGHLETTLVMAGTCTGTWSSLVSSLTIE